MNPIVAFVPYLLLFAIIYMLLFRPQQKKQKEHRELVSKLKTGDRIVTNSGIYGTIAGVDEKTVMLKIADKVEIEIVRSAVMTVLTEDGKGN